MKFSVFTVGTPDYNIEETILKLKEYGYDGVEWRVAGSLKAEPQIVPSRDRWYWEYNKSTLEVNTILEDAESISSMCNKYNIEISSLTTYLQPDETEKIETVLKAADIMRCPRIRVSVPGYNGQVNYRELFNNTVEKFRVLEGLARKYKVKINIEIHHGTLIPSASAAYRLVSNFDGNYIGVIYDPGNMVHEGFEQYKAAMELLNEYVDHVHVKNAAWSIKEANESGYSSWQCSWAPLRKGQVDFKSLISALKNINYNGYLSFEDFSNEETTDEKLENNIKFIKGLL